VKRQTAFDISGQLSENPGGNLKSGLSFDISGQLAQNPAAIKISNDIK